jgi:hypothetical protein
VWTSLTVLLLMPPAIMGKATGPGAANAGLLVPSASSGNDFMDPFEGETSMASKNNDRNNFFSGGSFLLWFSIGLRNLARLNIYL